MAGKCWLVLSGILIKQPCRTAWAVTGAQMKNTKHYLAAMIGNTTGPTLSYVVTGNKLRHDATDIVDTAAHTAGRVPALFIAKPNGYKVWFMSSILGRNPLAVMPADVAASGVHLNKFCDCLYRAHGFRSLAPGLARPTIYMHKIPHRETSDEAAGVVVGDAVHLTYNTHKKYICVRWYGNT